MKRRKGLLDEEKFLPPLPEQLPRGVSSLPGYGQTSPVAQGLLGFTGRNPTYSVMSPEAQQMSDAYRLGEQASVASQLYGSVLPFAAASTMANAQRTGSLLSPLTVFHGSPHKFSKFDASKIGTGEGAQAYGHGLYFAENPAVAKEYSQRLSRNQYVDARPEIVDAEKKYFDAFNAWTKATINEKPKQEREQLKAIMDEAIKQKDEAYRLFGPQMYSVDLPDEQIAKMLDWDKPLSQQPKAFQDAVSALPRFQDPYVASKATGGEAYGELAGQLGGRDKAAEMLRQQGIPGIRYLDAGSRGKGGTSNFVVFPGEESKLRIMEVNGKPIVIDEEELRRSGLLGVAQ